MPKILPLVQFSVTDGQGRIAIQYEQVETKAGHPTDVTTIKKTQFLKYSQSELGRK